MSEASENGAAKRIPRPPKPPSDSDDEVLSPEEEAAQFEDEVGSFLVVEKECPTSTGCYSGQYMSELEFYQRTEVRTHGPFASYRAALVEAISLRDRDCRYEHLEPEELAEIREEGPPYTSPNNGDEDYECTIYVLEESVHKARSEEDEKRMRAQFDKRKAKALAANDAKRLKVQKKGNVHYSFPPEDFDIPAEIEIKSAEDAAALSPAKASTVKSLMVDVERLAAGDSSLPSLLASFTSLSELHLMNADWSDEDSVLAVLKASSTLSKTVRVLCLYFGHLSPESTSCLVGFSSLVELRLLRCFSLEYFDHDTGYDDEDDRADTESLPYDEALRDLREGLENFERLVASNGNDSESETYFHRYCCSEDIFEELRDTGLKVSRDDEEEDDDEEGDDDDDDDYN